MRRDLRYGLDVTFMFMLFVNVVIFAFQYSLGSLSPELLHTIERIDWFVVFSYYGFFLHGLVVADEKLNYVRTHVLLVILLIIPFVPFARLFRLHYVKHMLKIGADSVWHVLDRLHML